MFLNCAPERAPMCRDVSYSGRMTPAVARRQPGTMDVHKNAAREVPRKAVALKGSSKYPQWGEGWEAEKKERATKIVSGWVYKAKSPKPSFP